MEDVLLTALCAGCAAIEAPPTPAAGPQSSWEEIRGIRDVILKPPTIAFGARSVSVMDVCLGGDTLRATAGDGTALEKPAAGVSRDYQVGVGRLMGDAEMSSVRILFYKPFTIPACRKPLVPTETAQAWGEPPDASGPRRAPAKLIRQRHGLPSVFLEQGDPIRLQ
jgi:hypothetical protein